VVVPPLIRRRWGIDMVALAIGRAFGYLCKENFKLSYNHSYHYVT